MEAFLSWVQAMIAQYGAPSEIRVLEPWASALIAAELVDASLVKAAEPGHEFEAAFVVGASVYLAVLST